MMKEDCELHLTPCPDTFLFFFYSHFDGVSSCDHGGQVTNLLISQLYTAVTTFPGPFNVRERQSNNRILHHIHIIHHSSAA